MSQSPKISFFRIIIFLIIAITLSNIFRFDAFEHREGLKFLPSWIYVLTLVLLEGSGVFIGAILAIYLLKKERSTEMTLFGTSRKNALLMGIVPLILLTTTGVTNEFGMDNHIYGFIAILGTLIYCIMEEYGWRGYLQEELKSLEDWKKYPLIGLVWYLWHLTFLTSASLGDNLFFLGMMIVGSWGIGQVAESTKSVLASACFHLIIQIIMLNALIKNGIDGTEKIIILVTSVLIWFVIVKKWERETGVRS